MSADRCASTARSGPRERRLAALYANACAATGVIDWTSTETVLEMPLEIPSGARQLAVSQMRGSPCAFTRIVAPGGLVI
jgi:hypothetical protein